MAKMSGATPSSAVRYAGRRTRELLSPLDWKFLLYASSALPFGRRDDPRLSELYRLKPYYKGTRLLAAFAVALVLLSLLLPFTVLYVGLDGFFKLLIAYIIFFVVASIAGTLLEVALDAIFAIQHEMKASLSEAVQAFMRFLNNNFGYMARYMLIKLSVDMFLVALVTVLFLPALLGTLAMLQSLIHALTSGAADPRGLMVTWIIAIAILLLAAVFATGLLSVPISAFYGYYTEDAVKAMRQLEDRHGGE